MTVVAVVGAQWGDEGKGKVVDLLAERASVVARYQGGNNAGHTVINPLGEFRLQLVPAGIFDPKTTCIIGNGVVIDPGALLNEIDLLSSKGVDLDRLYVSERAHLVMPYHALQDRLEEVAKGARSIGTTGKGIGPAYADKVSRIGIRVADLLEKDLLREKLEFVLTLKNRMLTRLYDADPVPFQATYDACLEYGARLSRHVADTCLMIQQAVARNERVLLEGAQGTLLDVDFGTYPYVTSSSPTAGAVCSGLGLPPTAVDRVIGIYKAYCTRVGEGPFPTEVKDEVEQIIRERGHEYGTVTGRPRRIGWFDSVLARHTARINGFNYMVVNRLDILDTLPTLKICTRYIVNRVETEYAPVRLDMCEPVYEEHPGWQMETGHVRAFRDLPLAARNYLERIAELVGVKLAIVSVGPRREDTITIVDDLF